MRIIDCEQGTDEWRMARCGVATASRASCLVTPARLQPSKQLRGYAIELAAERILGRPLDDDAGSAWMTRGTELEDEALGLYGLEKGGDVIRAGFCVTEDGAAGCSPDALVDEDGGAEVKCPSAKVHLGYLVDDGVPKEYLPQIQFSLWVTRRRWWDFVSFCPSMPLVVRRVWPDPRWTEALDEIVPRLRECVELILAKARAAGCETAADRFAREEAERKAREAALVEEWFGPEPEKATT